ncbi:predicted protein [Nematostella vectensis]|uniref:Uncharacterized protein n=1 Tax=Nematostella vectensis TaxID=45351 RepID=A7SA33_NEMVE|nr:predicted protein [Nematostella vectensis]|eukprot:XP_001631452.1 predicted protein [Nematostella vectensis]
MAMSFVRANFVFALVAFISTQRSSAGKKERGLYREGARFTAFALEGDVLKEGNRLSVRSREYVTRNTSLTARCNVTSTSTEDSVTENGVTLVWSRREQMLVSGNASVALVIDDASPDDAGVYVCSAVSGLAAENSLAVINFTAVIGDPPGQPGEPFLEYLYGFPPSVIGALAFKLNINPTTSNCKTAIKPEISEKYELLLSPNRCYRIGTLSAYQAAHVCTQKDRVTNKVVCDISQELRKCPDWKQRCRYPVVGCGILSAVVKATNVFGSTYSSLSGWNLPYKTKCGLPSNLQAIDVQRNLVTLSWHTPDVLMDSSRSLIHFQIRCSPGCGGIVQLSVRSREYVTRNTSLTARCNVTSTSTEDSVTENGVTLVWSRREQMLVSGNASVALVIDDASPDDAGVYVCSAVSGLAAENSLAVINFTAVIGVPRGSVKFLEYEEEPIDTLTRNFTLQWQKPDQESLKGRLRKYLFRYWREQNESDVYSSVSTRDVTTLEVDANNTSVVLSDILRDMSYVISLEACTSVGCTKPSYYVLKREARPVSKKVFSSRVRATSSSLAGSGMIALCVILGTLGLCLITGVIVWFHRRNQGTGLRESLPHKEMVEPMQFKAFAPPEADEPYSEISAPGPVRSRSPSEDTAITET